jgi:L-alanine-DL-glutamate epimerase-like enolase superfamily enzyme
MRIKQLHVYQHALPVCGGPFCTSRTGVSVLDTTIVELVTDAGLVGYGETCPLGPTYQPHHALGARSALEEMGPHLIGCRALHIDCVRDVMDEALAGHRYAKAAVDIALWDVAGKAYGARTCDLLGGAKREMVSSYYSMGVMEPDAAASVATQRQAEGYRRLQLKVGGRDPEVDIEAIRKVHRTLTPGVKLVVDANRGWTTREALHVSTACRDLPFVLEQPCATYEENAALCRRAAHPIFLDENTEDLEVVLRAVGDRVCDGFGLKVTRVGGLSAMRTIRDVCHAVNLPFTCDDAWGGDIIAAACVHIGATASAHLLEGVWIAAPYIDRHYDVQNGPRVENGLIRVPRGPGLGIVPDKTLWGRPVMSFG